jgi:hypothetical protein
MAWQKAGSMPSGKRSFDVLATRDLAPTEGDRQRILDCTDFDQLKTWLRKAVTVTKVSDLFS